MVTVADSLMMPLPAPVAVVVVAPADGRVARSGMVDMFREASIRVQGQVQWGGPAQGSWSINLSLLRRQFSIQRRRFLGLY